MSFRSAVTPRLVRAMMFAAMLVPADATAQYFGRNKVQYEDFDFEVMRTAHFAIYHYQQERKAVEQAARMAERWRTRLGTVLEFELPPGQPLILYANHADFEQTDVVQGLIGESTGGVTDLLKRRMVLPFAGGLAETSHVLGHEMAHAYQFAMGGRNTARLPLWFVEGMAEYLSLGPVDPHTAMWLRDATLREELPDFEDLTDPRLFPYRYGHAAWAYLAGRFGDRIVPTLYSAASETGDPLGAIAGITKQDLESLSKDWHASLTRAFAQSAPRDTGNLGRSLISEEQDGGEINVAPSLSPDGRWLVFLSERDLFSIDMYLANATTGEVVRKLTETATDPHLESLQFIHSAGAWDAASRRFAFAAVSEGDPTLNILDVEQNAIVRKIEVPELGEIFHPTWSPDGRRIAFAAIVGGISDLFVYDLEASRLRRLTNDLYTELQPAWSPDGRALVVVTDRFTTNLDELDFGDYRLARLDLDTSSMSPLSAFDDGKHINPQWGDDGAAVYFIGDPDGIANVFRLDVASGRLAQVTRVATGISGITALSPALSYATATKRLAYSVFSDGQYEIRALDDPARLAEVAVTEHRGQPAAALPPREAPKGLVAQGLRAAERGLPERADYPVADYDADLALDYVGAGGGLSSGVGRWGAFAEGSVTMRFSDMLGQHVLTTTAQVNGRLADFAGQLAYLNQSSRWGWGGALQQIPYTTGGFRQSLGQIDGEPVVVEEELIFRQTDRELVGVTQHPFNRSLRAEFRAGFRNVSFDRNVTTRVFSLETGQIVREFEDDLQAPGSLNLGEAAVALVHDTSVFGVTSPVFGSRYRLEVAPTFGSIRYTEVLLDYRRYQVLAEPFTLALRGIHVGRFGIDAEDSRLSSLFVGYPNLVRGYDINSFDFTECRPSAENGCRVIDDLLGSRLLVGNAELRFPLVGAFKGEFDYEPLPIEGFVFADTGIAWTRDQEPSFAGGGRDFVSSVGLGARVNVFGYLVTEFNAVRPLDREGRGWSFVFNLRPGF
jgi:Tol biopolymer transport system component